MLTSVGGTLSLLTGRSQPTHDDITYESIAEAFGRTLVEDALTVSKMTAHYTKQGKEVNAARMRMAILPSGPPLPPLWIGALERRH
jgi:molybdopterin-biosynthesis enzyme MoeA-like protein